jgi:flagellar biosynthesis/type III secretory pathway M-ring protein FliF/YscJ
MLLGGGALTIVVALGGALFIMRKRSSRRPAATDTAAAAIPAAPNSSDIPPAASGLPRSGISDRLREGEAEQARLEAEIVNSIKMPLNTKATEVLVRHVREASQKDPASAANVLRAWMTEGDNG